MKRKSGEHYNQCRLFQWANIMTSEYPELRWLFAIPNGGQRDVRVAVKLKREGVKRGVWDVCLLSPRGKFHGLFIEMKYGKNKLTDDQAEFGEFIKAQNYDTIVAYNWNQAADKIESYLKGKK